MWNRQPVGSVWLADAGGDTQPAVQRVVSTRRLRERKPRRRASRRAAARRAVKSSAAARAAPPRGTRVSTQQEARSSARIVDAAPALATGADVADPVCVSNIGRVARI